MATKGQKIKVGIFLIVNVAVFAVVLLALMGYKRGEQVPYWCEFKESILGLNKGAVVEYLGVPIGTVSDIWVTARNTAHVEMVINSEKVTLRQGVQATLVIYSLATGVMYVSLAGGEGDPLPPESEIPTAPSLVEQLRAQAQSLLTNLASIAARVDDGLSGLEEGQLARVIENADGFVSDSRTLVNRASDTIEAVRQDFQPAIDDFRKTLDDIRVLSQNADKLAGTLKTKLDPLDLAKTEADLQKALESIAALTQRLQTTAEVLDKMSTGVLQESSDVEYSVRTGVERLRDTLESINSLAEYLQQDPSALVRGKGKPEEGR